MPAASEVRSLFRQFLRHGRTFPNYNVREYILRRSKDGFRQAAAESDAAKLEQRWKHALEDLDVMKRQSVVYQLYGRKHKNVLEVDAAQQRA